MKECLSNLPFPSGTVMSSSLCFVWQWRGFNLNVMIPDIGCLMLLLSGIIMTIFSLKKTIEPKGYQNIRNKEKNQYEKESQT